MVAHGGDNNCCKKDRDIQVASQVDWIGAGMGSTPRVLLPISMGLAMFNLLSYVGHPHHFLGPGVREKRLISGEK